MGKDSERILKFTAKKNKAMKQANYIGYIIVKFML